MQVAVEVVDLAARPNRGFIVIVNVDEAATWMPPKGCLKGIYRMVVPSDFGAGELEERYTEFKKFRKSTGEDDD